MTDISLLSSITPEYRAIVMVVHRPTSGYTEILRGT
jgi:hypothetical protein